MMKYWISTVPFFTIIFGTSFVAATDDRFIRRYAMMKMYESCFGAEVIKDVRQEMKQASVKCANLYKVPLRTPPPKLQIDSAENLKTHAGIDLTRLHQAILAGYKQLNQPTTSSQYSANGHGFTNVRPWNFAPAPYYAPPASAPYAPPAYPVAPLYQPTFYSAFHGFGRTSKEMDIRNQIESLAMRISGRIRNVTCIMQELGYLNENLEPDYLKIIDRIRKLEIADDLKTEMADGVEYCKAFSQCVPDERKDKFSKDVMKPMFFFRCYKHKKMEACILKDIKEKYSSEELEDNLIVMDRSERSGRDFNGDDIAEWDLHELLYDENNVDIDSLP